MEDIENVKCVKNIKSIIASFSLHTSEEQEQIASWINCRNSPDAFIQESFPATCVLGEDRFKQPVFFADESQWQKCIALEDVKIVDNGSKPDKCITSDDVFYIEP
jgi:hypothetical protein